MLGNPILGIHGLNFDDNLYLNYLIDTIQVDISYMMNVMKIQNLTQISNIYYIFQDSMILDNQILNYYNIHCVNLINNNHPNYRKDPDHCYKIIYVKDNVILGILTNCDILMTNYQDTILQDIYYLMMMNQVVTNNFYILQIPNFLDNHYILDMFQMFQNFHFHFQINNNHPNSHILNQNYPCKNEDNDFLGKQTSYCIYFHVIQDTILKDM